MPKLIQTTTTETETTWKGLANLIKGGGGTLKIGDIITEKTLDGEEMDLVIVDMGPDWARFESKDCLPVKLPTTRTTETPAASQTQTSNAT